MPTKIIKVENCKGCPFSAIFRYIEDGKSVEGVCCTRQQNRKVPSSGIDENCPLMDTDEFIEGG